MPCNRAHRHPRAVIARPVVKWKAVMPAVGGIGFGKDASATTAVKKFFSRARPSDDLHHSFSFPSGHSTSAYFILGFFFFLVVPALASWSASLSAESPTDPSSSADPISGQTGALTALQQALEAAAKPRAALALTIAGGAVTQSGRLLADVHWVSDVLAGSLWGASGVALACVVYDLGAAMTAQPEGTVESTTGAAGKEQQPEQGSINQ